MLKEKTSISQEDIMTILDACYGKCLNGIPRISQSVEELAQDYLDKYPNKEQACKAMIKNQIMKCTTSGFLSGSGGIITLPVALPANITSVLYVQMRMIACTAYLAGFKLSSDQTQTSRLRLSRRCIGWRTDQTCRDKIGNKINKRANQKNPWDCSD